mgnify:FL=1
MTTSQNLWFHLPPDNALDWLRLANVLLGSYFIGMCFQVMWLYRDRKPIYHVRWISGGTMLLVIGVVTGQLGLIGEGETRVSWPISVIYFVALIPMIAALHSLLRRADFE